MQTNICKRLKTAYKEIKKSLIDPNVSPWISDNFYCIDKHYRVLIANKNALRHDSLFYVIYSCCEDNDFLPSPKSIVEKIRSEKRAFDFFSLESVDALVCACSIIKIGESLKSGQFFDMIPNAVKTLRTISNPEFLDILPSVWKPESLIASFEEDYTKFSFETKMQYRKALAKIAKKEKVDETVIVNRLIQKAKERNCNLGDLLFKPEKTKILLWGLIVSVVFASLSGVSLYLIGWRTLLLLIPYGIASGAIADYIASRFTNAFFALRIELDSIPNNAKTLVTIASLMTGGENDEKVYESLLRFRYMNPDENIYFCLLADLPDADTPYMPNDKEIIKSANDRIEKLNQEHGNRFCLFFRERVLNKSEERFGGWERKRGAVCELVSHIVNGGKREYCGSEFIRDIKYIITLDSDTNLSVGSVRELLSIALHPVNRVRIKNGRVVSGYGIIQPLIRTELKSAYKTNFSRLISGSGGADIYSGASFLRSQSLFGSGSFCGKGLIDVFAFEELVCNAFPEGVVLSHDVLEGAILRTLAATDITLTDSTPANTVSFFRRLHRWMRGDFQNLIFLASNHLNLFSKLRLIATALRHLSPVFSFAALISASFLTKTDGLWIFYFAYSEFLLPCNLTFIMLFFDSSPFACLRFFSKAYSMILETALRLFFEICSACRRAILTLDALILAAIRLCTRKKTLEWTTAAQTEKLSSTLGKYVLDGLFSVVIGLLLLVFAKPSFLKLLGLIWFIYPFVSSILAKNIGGGGIALPQFTCSQKETLIAHASDMFSFYYDNVNEKTFYLPPDNVQISPVFDIAMRTSPTNIGFYLVSLLGAYDLKLIGVDELCERLSKTIDVLDRLEKYNGNLFNWYSLEDLSVIGEKYVSFVDSGNFVVMLVALKEGLKEYSKEKDEINEIIIRVERLISNTDFKIFYDERRALFSIGIRGDGRKDSSFYDMLMSEARMSSYYAVASAFVPKKHWQSLGRTLAGRKGYIGMMSWSGSAFEYFMPQLFLPLYRDSFMYESIAFALAIQRMENKIWGVSESGFYSFDSEMHYQYKANGIQTLALRRIEKNEKIISPYSTYLSLCVCQSAAFKNLYELERCGMYGKYGLYEALDFNSDLNGICVKSYMAHHVGMSIIAILNAVKDNIFVRRFMSDIKMASANELLQEKIPTNAHLFEYGEQEKREIKRVALPYKTSSITPEISNPSSVLLTRGDFKAIVTSSGHISLSNGERELVNTVFDKYSLRFSPSVLFTRMDETFSCVPMYGGDGFGFEHNRESVSHIASSKSFSGRVQYAMAKNCNCFVVNTRAEALKKYDITLAFEPVLETKQKFQAHISFSRLFIESEYDERKRILYFHRRSRFDGKYVFTLAVAPKDKKDSFSFLSSRESLSSFAISSSLDYGTISTDNSIGPCIDPFCVVRSMNVEGGKTTFLITCGQTVEECERNIRIARTENSFIQSINQTAIEEKLLTHLLYKKKSSVVEKFALCSINDLWSRGISGDYPLALILISEIAKNRTETLLNAFVSLAKDMIRCEMIFIVSDDDLYNRPVERALRESIDKTEAKRFIGRNGGIFIIRKSEINPEFESALISHSSFFYNFSNGTPGEIADCDFTVSEIITKPQNAIKLALPNNAFASGNGYFENDSYVIDKSMQFTAPYSFVLTGRRFSTVVTQSSLGYTFYDNARERRLCSFYGDSRTLDNGERVFFVSNNKKYDLCAVSNKVVYEKGKATYYGNADGNDFTVTVCVDEKFPVKLIRVQYQKGIDLKTCFSIDPVMGDSVGNSGNIAITRLNANGNSGMLFRNTFSMTFPEGFGFAGVCGGTAKVESQTFFSNSNDVIFFIGACTTELGAKNIASRINRKFFDISLGNSIKFAKSLVPEIMVSTKSESVDVLMNSFLPYQVAACRMYARGSFYQSGGAYGFRDQLQDCLSLVYSNPKAVRVHILRCAAHQYLEGDVMHWWHTRNINGVNNGIRSKCSDDLLYLPFVVADYIEKSGDIQLLDTEVNYITSPPLENQSERYELPSRSNLRENIYRHCLRALARADQRGKHGLILMGSCDWNDAFSLVGEKGIGESVFSTLLYIIVVKKFMPILHSRGDDETANHFEKTISELSESVENNAFFKDRYARAFCDDGTVLGIEGCKECEIDILSQAFAALAGLDENRTKTALKTAFSMLYDSKSRIFKLFSPPFANSKTRVGYIRGYVSGIRENGGQYTHGALWGALGFLAVGMNEEALAVIECANPASRCKDKNLSQKYKNEPFVVSADIYSGVHEGRGGWSWYTGAASWFYRIMLENIFGLKIGANQTLIAAKPIIAFEAEIALGNAILHIKTSRENDFATANGKKISFPFRFEKGEYSVLLPIA